MEKMIDVEKLREKLIDYYGTGAAAGMPAMMVEIRDIEKMSEEEVVNKAKMLRFNLFK